jgi:hypothetical protein
MTRTDLCVNKPHKSRSYLNHLLYKMNFCGCFLCTSACLSEVNQLYHIKTCVVLYTGRFIMFSVITNVYNNGNCS